MPNENNDNDDDNIDNIDIYKVHFNPLSCLFEENDSDSFQLNTDCSELMVGMQCSYNTLESCKHVGTDDFNSLVTQRFDNSKNTLSVLFLNINGVKSNFDSFLAQAQSITMKFSFICFCETNLKSDEPDYYSIPNYSSEKLYAIDDKHSGSGITVYFKSSLNFRRIEKLCVRNSTFEALGGTFNSNFGKITLIVLYRFHRSDNNINFTKLVENYISVLKGPVILVGDFNLDTLPSEKSSDSNKYINCFLSHGYVPLISKGTRVSSNKVTSIDNI